MKAVLAVAAALLMLLSGAFSARSLVQIGVIDFVVDWPTLIGSPVEIRDGVVVGFDDRSAILKNGTALIYLFPPWRDREDLRFLLKRCGSLIESPGCAMGVYGVATKKEFMEDRPTLTDVDFFIQQ